MLPSHYDRTLVALSILIAIGAGYATLNVAERITCSSTRFQKLWVVIGAICLGFGIWSTHYVGMLAFRLAVPVRYDLALVIWSLLAAIGSAAAALTLLSRPTPSKLTLCSGAVVLGCGIAGMHYIGMAAMRASCICSYSVPLVVLSVAVAIAISGIAINNLRNLPTRIAVSHRAAGSIVLGIAITSVHYIGMAAAHFVPSPAPVDTFLTLGVSSLGALAVAGIAIVLMTVALIGTLAERSFTAQTDKLETTEQRYELLFEKSLASIFRSTIDGSIIDCNPALVHLLGANNKSEIIGRSLDAQILTPEAREVYFRLVVENGSMSGCETRIHCADGSLIWVFAAGTLIHSQHAPPEVQGMFLSIQDLKRKELELQNANLLAEAANQAKAQFLANMSHELRTPLVAVLGMTEILNSSEPTVEQHECLGIIHESAESLLAMIGRILEFSGKSSPILLDGSEALSLSDLIEGEMQAVRTYAESKKLSLVFVNELKDHSRYYTQARKIRLSVRALLENSVKFSDTGKVFVTIWSDGEHAGNDFLRISIRDAGIGIAPGLYEAIFEAFNQADISHSRGFGGAGIGLALAREAIRSLGGDIVVTSDVGSGSTFLIKVSLARERETGTDSHSLVGDATEPMHIS